MLTDRYRRPLTNFRISVTERCNLNCFYCHREGAVGHHKEMAIEEFYPILRVASEFGMRKLKITGGEPLVRENLAELVAQAKPLFKEISLTTNGIALAEQAEVLKTAGLDRVNISLDTLDPEKYARITCTKTKPGEKSVFDRVIDGIDAARDAGLVPIKINMVAMKDLNIDEIPAMMSFCAERGMILQLIEMVYKNPQFYSLDDLEKELAEATIMTKENEFHRRKKYYLDAGGKTVVELVRPMDNSVFCANCKRLRLTADGSLKPCLLRSDNMVNVRGLDGEELVAAFKKAVDNREPYYKEACAVPVREREPFK